MTTPMRNRMHRHTRPAGYVSKARQAESMAFGRPGGCTFSFNGEFPEAGDHQPVEATSRHRNYMAVNHTGGYHVVRQDDTRRMPVINKYGVHGMTALAIFALLVVMLGSILLHELDVRKDVQNDIAMKNTRVTVLTSECKRVKDAIDLQNNDVSIHQAALRMGLIKSQGVTAQYLEVPADAVITLPAQTGIQSLASIWGQ